jgi:hypothetical protein
MDHSRARADGGREAGWRKDMGGEQEMDGAEAV